MNDRNIWLHFNLHIFNDRGLQQGVSDLLRNKSILISDNLPAIVYQPYTPKTTVTEMGQQILIKKYMAFYFDAGSPYPRFSPLLLLFLDYTRQVNHIGQVGNLESCGQNMHHNCDA